MRIRNFLVLLLMTAFFSVSCAPDRHEGITITIMGKESDLRKSYMTSIFDQYQKATGNRLNIISYKDSDFEIEAAKEFSAGNVPDIFLHFHNADLNQFDVDNNFYYLNEKQIFYL